MDIMVSRLFFASVTSSSNCFILDSKSGEGHYVDWIDGRAFGCSSSRDWDVVLRAILKVNVIEGFDIWAVFRMQFSWKAVKHGGSTVKGMGSEEGEGS